jgi:hypothetical protein
MPLWLLSNKYSVIYFTIVEYFPIYVAISNIVVEKSPSDFVLCLGDAKLCCGFLKTEFLSSYNRNYSKSQNI